MVSISTVTSDHAEPHPADDAAANAFRATALRVSPQQWAVSALARVAAPVPRGAS
jgi:hypothetical protein